MTPPLFSFGRNRRRKDSGTSLADGVTHLPLDGPDEPGLADGSDGSQDREGTWPAGSRPGPAGRGGQRSGSAFGLDDATDLPAGGEASGRAGAAASEARSRGRHRAAGPHGSERVEEALARWREELVDLGGVASLGDASVLEGVVDLTAAHPSGLAQLYAGRSTHLSNLVRERSALAVARQSLREVAGRTDVLARQFGVAPVYLALGVASWTESVPAPEGEEDAALSGPALAPGTGGDAVARPAGAGVPDFLAAAGLADAGPDLSGARGASGASAGADAAGQGADGEEQADPAGPSSQVDPVGPDGLDGPDGTDPSGVGTGAGQTGPGAAGPLGTDQTGPGAASQASQASTDQGDAGQALRRTVNAPVLLRPVRLAATGGDATLTLGPSIEVNPVLTRALREAGCRTDVDAIARGSLSEVGFTPRAALTRLASLGRQWLTDFHLEERLVVGAFVHPGQALVEDFDATVERARNSALVAALAGDEDARAVLAVDLPDPDPRDREPGAERGVGDLDVAQLDAVEAVSSGASLLLNAPPGSDVAATLAAILADAAASGRTVLHVPATSADGHAVADALREQGLGDLVVDLTEDPGWRLHAAEAIKDSLGVAPPELDVDAIMDLRERLSAVRAEMSDAVDALHEPRAPWGVSAYEALGHLAEFTTGRARRYTSARVVPGHLERLDEAGLTRGLELLERAEDLGLLTAQGASSAWKGVVVTDIDQATDALARLTRLADELLPAMNRDVAVAAEVTGMDPAASVTQWCTQLEVMDGVRDSLDVFLPEVFERSAADLIIATATKQWRTEHAVEMSASTRRRFTKQAKDLVRPGRPVEDLHAELVKVQRRREAWRACHPGSGWPKLPAGLDVMAATAAEVRQTLEEVQPLLDTTDHAPVLVDMPLAELAQLVGALADDDATAQALPEVNRVLAGLTELGLTDLLADLAQREVSREEIEPELMYCWWASLLADLLRTDPSLAGLDSGVLGERAALLRELDAAQVQTLAGPMLYAYASGVREAVEADKDTARALYVALSRDDGVPLREILAAYPLAMRVKPVWIVPPTLVPQVLVPDAVVDLAVLDASVHMPVCQVLPAFVRAAQVLVVGDPRRDESGLAAELGALLPSVVLPTTRNTLDGPIASFLATHGYGEVVEPIPSPPGGVGLSLELVDGRGMPAPGQTAVESVPAEVDRVVDLVIDHALSRPEESLGVVALSARHAAQVRRAVAGAVTGSPALEQFFATGIAEPFVVVDLSEVRSLRRDRIIISVGYAKTPHGRTIHSFGAVSQVGGMVGLVEALCAARRSTHVVSCLSAQDIDPERLHSPGSQLLREMLVRAAGEGDSTDAAQGGEGQPDPLLVDLAERLWRKGLVVIPRYGLDGGMRIPLAIGHPDCPGELLVAVLTDDAGYVAEPSLRRRDRYWRARLAARGWRVYTTYSVSLFVDPEAEASAIEQIVLDVLASRAIRVRGAEPVPAGVEADPVTGEVLEAGEPGGAGGRADGAGVAAGGEAGSAEAEQVSVQAPVRATRPPIAPGLPLQAYSDDQLDDLVTWIRSDGLVRSVEEEVEELRGTLALRRRGAGVDAVLTHAVTRSRHE